MSTTAASLIEQVRSTLRDHGNGTTTLAAAVSDTTSTSISLESIADLSPKQFLMIDNEMVEVRSTFEGTPATATVLRGARGSTAATHTNGTVVRIEPVFGNHEYLRFLNQALEASFPSLYSAADDSTTRDIAASTYEYDIPATVTKLVRVEIETSTSGVYEVNRNWDYQDNNTIIIENAGTIPTGRGVRFVGYAKFDAMTLAGTLDADFPDTNATAIEYLIVKATAHALRVRQAPLGRRDSFVGITDAWQQAQPFMSTLSAKDFENHAASMLKSIRMPRIPEYVSDPGRVYFGRG